MDTKVAQSTRCHFNQSMYAYERGGGGGGGGVERKNQQKHYITHGKDITNQSSQCCNMIIIRLLSTIMRQFLFCVHYTFTCVKACLTYGLTIRIRAHRSRYI